MGIERVTDRQLIAEAFQRLHTIYEHVGLPCWTVRDEWLERNDTAAMVVVTGDAPDPEQFSALVRAFAAANADSVLAVQCIDYDYSADTNAPWEAETFTFSPDVAGLEAFVTERHPLYFALLPTSGVGWTVWLDRDDFMVVAGPRDLVDAYAGGEMPALIDEFRAYIERFESWADDPSAAPWMRHLQWMQDSVGDTRPLPPVISWYELPRARRDTAE